MDKIDGYKQTKRGPKEILEIYQEYFSVFSCFLSTVLTVDYLKSVAYNMIWRTAGNHLFFLNISLFRHNSESVSNYNVLLTIQMF